MRRLKWTAAAAIAGTIALASAPTGFTERASRLADPRAMRSQVPPPAPQSPAAPRPIADLSAPAPGARSPRNASYSIDARLDARNRTLTGREIVTWRNISTASASELQFHLYFNAWKNTHSTWMRERMLTPSAAAVASRPEADWGWIDVSAVRLLGGDTSTDLTAQKRFIAPDDGNADDQTVMAVALPKPVAPGETVRVEVAWTSRIPRTFARTGAIGNYFFIAQWFPKLGVLESGGWNCHQFHLATEFYADYGSYDVRLTVPADWIVGATGRQTSAAKNADNTTTHEYREDDVHDFAWTTSPDYIERTARFEHATLPAVDLRLLLQPEHASQADRHFNATRVALQSYGEWFGPYPYDHLTIVDPAYQSGAGGMEYPTLFTAGTRWIAPEGVTSPEGVTVHEAGHQFWYGVVGTNEFEHAWMDEGFNTFSTARAIEQAYEPNFLALRYFGGFIPYVLRDIPLSRAVDGNRLAGYRTAARMDAQSTPSFRYWPATSGNITYDKTALWLNSIENTVPWSMLQRALSQYYDRWKFRHPKPDDFFAILEETTAGNPIVRQIVEEGHRGSNVLDYGVQMLTSEPIAPQGFVDGSGGRQFTTANRAAATTYRTIVVVRRYGEAVVPVDVAVEFAGGDILLEHWDGRDRWKAYTYERPERAELARVDPERKLLLDVSYTNNSRTLRPDGDAAALKWMLKYVVWLEDLLITYGMFV